MIIATAGHVDHGKSALVEALTGHSMDRLAEERARGMTIDLNFASLAIGGALVGVVDVPGHEDFLRTMAAGAAGVDLVLLVVATDDGPRPQTWEHLAVAEMLGVGRGILVLTKADLGAPERQAEVAQGLALRLGRSRIPFEGPIAVSARTGEGLDLLREVLEREVTRAPLRDEADAFRMPIDRVFTVRGTGTVVTGSVWSGAVAVGDHLTLLPSGRRARIRGIEVHGGTVIRVAAGSRAALALAGIGREDVARGETAVDDQLPWQAIDELDAEITLLEEAAEPLRSGSRVHLHLGTEAVVARVRAPDPIAPGARGPVRLRLERPLTARGGDRFLLRRLSPVATIGGGIVVDALPDASLPCQTPPDPADAWARVEALLRREPSVVRAGRVALRAGASVRKVDDFLGGSGRYLRAGGAWLAAQAVAEAERALVARLEEAHGARPTEPGVGLEALRRGVGQPPEVVACALERLRASATVVVESGIVRKAEFAPVPGVSAAVLDRIVAELEAAGPEAPGLAALEAQSPGVDVRGALRLAAEQGRVEPVRGDWYLAAGALAGFRRHLAAEGQSGDITIAGLKGRTGLSRKYLIPLLEWADRRGLTRRVGEVRRLT